MKPSSTFTRRATPFTRTPRDVTDFLRSDNVMASLMPAITRMAALQKNCAAILPTIFKSCAVMNFADGQLVLSTPNAALAAKLKQQLPKLQERLLQDGWQVDTIRIKVQVGKDYVVPVVRRKLILPNLAVSSLAELNDAIEDSASNLALKTALANMIRRNSGIK